MRKYIKILESADSPYLKRTVNTKPVGGDWKAVLANGDEIAEYISSLNPQNDRTALAEYFADSRGVLVIRPIDSLKEGPPEINVPDSGKQADYDSRDIATIPPLVVNGSEVLDGNHRLRSALRAGITHMAVYDVSDATISEARVIQLGGAENSSAKQALAEFESMTSEHPFNHKARIAGNATVEMSTFGNELHISDVRAITPRIGGGTEAMKMICSLADKHGVKITLTAKAYLDRENDTMNTKMLKIWYEKFGFYEEEETFGDDWSGYDMIRYPQ